MMADDELTIAGPPVWEKNPHAAALGRLGGKKGGPARAAKLTAERRQEIARKAAGARWQSHLYLEESGVSQNN